MIRHLGIIREFGLNAVVAVNRFPDDMDEEIELVQKIALANGAFASEVNDGVAKGGAGRAGAGRGGRRRRRGAVQLRPPLPARGLDRGARSRRSPSGSTAPDGVFLLPAAREKIRAVRRGRPRTAPDLHGKDPSVPVARSAAHQRADRLHVPVRDIRAYTGAGWLVALCGDMQTMPGLGKKPAAFDVDIDDRGRRPLGSSNGDVQVSCRDVWKVFGPIRRRRSRAATWTSPAPS